MKIYKILPALFISLFVCLFLPRALFSQTEKLDIIEYTPPNGWERTPRDRAVVFTDTNKTTGKFCVLTLYASGPGSGSSAKDFADQWNELVVKKLNAQPNPKTESQASGDGWQAMVGGAQIETDGLGAIAILSVYSGFGKTVSVLALFNDQTYLSQIDAFGQSLKLDKTAAKPLAAIEPSPSSGYLDFDPFPDKPYVQPQQPLLGRLKKTITLPDLAGKWQMGGASVTSYFSGGNYSHTDTSFFGEWLTIRSNGTFDSKFQGRTSNTTIRESDSGTILLSGGTVTFKYNHKAPMRYQFVAFMEDPKGGSVLTMIHIGDGALFDAEGLRANCGHAHGYVTCVTGEEWMRLP